MKAFLLAAGTGTRFLPVTRKIPKALFPFLNVPLARAHLARLRIQGVREAGINLHHLGDEIQSRLSDRSPDLPELTFFREETILGSGGGLKNAAGWLGQEDFLAVNCDTAIDVDLERLASAHRKSGRLATLLVVENREPDRYTPLQAEGDTITAFGAACVRPLLYTGISLLSPRLFEGLSAGNSSLVADVWNPMLARGEEIGYVLHEGPFADLGRAGDFLRASLEALERRGPFPAGAGVFDEGRRVLSARVSSVSGVSDVSGVSRSVLGRARIAETARVAASVVWDGVEIGAGARIERCLVAGGVVADGGRHSDALLWPGSDGVARPHVLHSPPHGFQSLSPRR